ncbi:MAG: hypothetical protein FWC92_01735 [Defluviitaleaceae bacterium]|nr:hypothetical protein [Defluviitaleaceae bacterium]
MSETTMLRIEDAIQNLPAGSLRNNALSFVEFLNNEGLTPVKCPWTENKWKIPFGEYYIGWISLSPKSWSYENFNYLQFDEYVDDDHKFATTIHKYVKVCKNPCHDECWGAMDVMVFDKQFNNVCSNHGLAISNPSMKTIEHIKKLISYNKKIVPRKHIYHCHNL